MTQSRAELCVRYARSMPWITKVLVGCETMEQLRLNADAFTTEPLTPAQVKAVEDALPHVPVNVLNPALWPDTKGYGGSFKKS